MLFSKRERNSGLHQDPQCVCGGLGGELEKIEKKFRSRTVNVFEKWFQR